MKKLFALLLALGLGLCAAAQAEETAMTLDGMWYVTDVKAWGLTPTEEELAVCAAMRLVISGDEALLYSNHTFVIYPLTYELGGFMLDSGQEGLRFALQADGTLALTSTAEGGDVGVTLRLEPMDASVNRAGATPFDGRWKAESVYAPNWSGTEVLLGYTMEVSGWTVSLSVLGEEAIHWISAWDKDGFTLLGSTEANPQTFTLREDGTLLYTSQGVSLVMAREGSQSLPTQTATAGSEAPSADYQALLADYEARLAEYEALLAKYEAMLAELGVSATQVCRICGAEHSLRVSHDINGIVLCPDCYAKLCQTGN